MQIFTSDGLIERELLTVKDIVEEVGSFRTTATEWYLGEKLVRRDVHLNLLRPLDINSEQGAI